MDNRGSLESSDYIRKKHGDEHERSMPTNVPLVASSTKGHLCLLWVKSGHCAVRVGLGVTKIPFELENSLAQLAELPRYSENNVRLSAI